MVDSNVFAWFGGVLLNWLFLIEGIAYSEEDRDKHELMGWFFMIFFAMATAGLSDALGYIGYGMGFVLLVVSVTKVIELSGKE